MKVQTPLLEPQLSEFVVRNDNADLFELKKALAALIDATADQREAAHFTLLVVIDGRDDHPGCRGSGR